MPESRWGASYATQFRVLLSRAVRVRRFQALSIQVRICSAVATLILHAGTVINSGT